MYEEDEYTDYSCSTAVERLSRDIETILRAWHVDKGSDHHVSAVQEKADDFGGDLSSSCTLIRSNPIVWNLSLMTAEGSRTSVSIDLELALWDAPISPATPVLANERNPMISSQLVQSLQQRLLLQQQRVASYSTASIMLPNDDLFENFSRLFGIGQHISLTPIQTDPIPLALIESLGSQVVQRHQHHLAVPTRPSESASAEANSDGIALIVLMSALSGWLQNALNLATASCRCGIPAFGVWGDYRPDTSTNTTLYPSETPAGQFEEGSKAMSNGEPAFPTQAGHMKSSQLKNNGNGDMLVGTTIQTTLEDQKGHSNSGRLADLTNMQTNVTSPMYNKGLGSSSVGTPSASPTGVSQASIGGPTSVAPSPIHDSSSSKWGGESNYLHEQRNKHTGKVVFPQWTQAVSRAPLPILPRPEQRKAIRNGSLNKQHVPPLVCGSVTASLASQQPPIQSSRMTSTMWVTGTKVLPSWNSSSFSTSRDVSHHAVRTNTSSNQLSIWANTLLKHCPGESTCALHGARHVFGWFKPTPDSYSSRANSGRQTRASRAAGYWAAAQEWREMNTALTSTPRPDETEFIIYKKHCQAHAMDVLEEAFQLSPFQKSSSDQVRPIWGPLDDPVAAVYATVTWNSKNGRLGTDDSVTSSTNRIEPILTFPLRIRSRRTLSRQDWQEMETSVESTILDPLSTPSRFLIEVHYDRETSVSTLTSTQRCILACLIRSATLPGETLLHHLTSVDLVALWDDHAGTMVATKLAEKSKVGPSTTSIVQAMDWSSIMKDMISIEEAEAIVHSILQGNIASGFPSSPEDSFLPTDDLCRPFAKTAPYGRLLSVLFAHMARLRSMSSMILVWNVFLQEVRRRWHARESLPNMQFVAGLDPHPLELYQKQQSFSNIGHKANFASFLNGNEPDPDDYNCLIGQKLQVFQIGVECLVSQELLENEVLERFLEQGQVPHSTKTRMNSKSTPDLTSTAIGSDMLKHDPLKPDDKSSSGLPGRRKTGKWPKSRQSSISEASSSDRKDYGPPAINSDLEFWVMDEPGYAPRDESLPFEAHQTDDTGFDFVAPPPKNLDDLDAPETSLEYRRRSMIVDSVPDVSQWEGTIMESDEEDEEDEDDGSNDSDASQTTTCSLSQAYFDAAEAGSIFSMKHGFVDLDTVVNVSDMRRRPGARCPVQGVALRTTGDQVYAPYLQRPCPLTDDSILERKNMLGGDQRDGENRKQMLQSRIEIAQRLQHSKLSSDMSSFKAANPNATLDDFTKWYGNPGSPLDEYDDEPIHDDVSVADAYYESSAKKLDKASEAMKILTATRDFWASTWEAARPVPAAEQRPLFDYETTVELSLDYLEQLHPASLLNQIMAVNLSSAYFALVSSASDVRQVPLVEKTLAALRSSIETSLSFLSDDATGALFQTHMDAASTATATANHYISEESLFACEQACNMMGVAETLMARAVSLLSKFPGQYHMVQELLNLVDGTQVALTDPVGRKSFLGIIQAQQDTHQLDKTSAALNSPRPVLREYVLQNHNDEKPCQLAVRFGDSDAYLDRVEGIEGGVLLALLQTKVE